MAGRLAGKVALISGTATGQGRAAAQIFTREGAKVVGCDFKSEDAEETLRLVHAAGGEMVSMQPVDLSKEEHVQRWIDFAIATYGGFDILYNNAAAAKFASIEDMTWDVYDFTIRNELDIIYWTCHLAWPHLVARGGGAIVNIASTAGLSQRPNSPGQYAHAAAKGGVISLTSVLAAEGLEYGIRANCVSPGFIATPQLQHRFEDPYFKRLIESDHPLIRAGRPEDIANAALFLASSEASYITNQNIVVDGGGNLTGSTRAPIRSNAFPDLTAWQKEPEKYDLPSKPRYN